MGVPGGTASSQSTVFPYGGAAIDANTPTEDQLVGNLTTLKTYDMVLFPCEQGPLTGSQMVYNQQTGAPVGTWSDLQTGYQTNVIDYANAGGRIFATHYSYIWLYNDVPFSDTATWDVGQKSPSDQTGLINMGFPKGQELAEWLQNIGASTTLGQIPISTLRWDVNTVDTTGPTAPSQLWMSIDNATEAGKVTIPMHYTFNTPVSGASQCGRVLFDDFHVEAVPNSVTDTSMAAGLDDGLKFPNECTTLTMTPQEKLLEFMIFDLGSCVAPAMPACTPKTCAEILINCGPADDGCGNAIQCGTCPAGEACGGGGKPSVCGAPTCTPRTCAALGINCGPAGDGCGGSLSCGGCPSGETCGAGGKGGVCGTGSCVPKTCSAEGIECGPAGDGCGKSLTCGSCPSGQTCGGGGKAGVCGSSCIPNTCLGLGYTCGAAGDGCGAPLDCGTCSAPETCGGGGSAGVCGGNIPK